MLLDPPTHPMACTAGAQGSGTASAGRVAVAEGCRDTVQSLTLMFIKCYIW